MISINILVWLGWLITRVIMDRYTNFNFDEIHHLDAGWALIIQGVALINLYLIIAGFIIILDDIIGHLRAHIEEGPLESLIRPIYNKLYSLLKKGK